MVGLLLETLALRDPTAARHAAAVAHYAHELARAAGLSEREQAVVHTAGLLHDIGKEALPDHILLGRSELHAAERRLVERHPADGARLLLRVEGLGEVANAVLAHHERIDGHGYPDGLAGDDIPMTARILAIAEVYDVLTAPDSYKIPLGAAEAEDELRRVAGSQLDGRLVWLFVTQVLRGTVIDHEGRIADLETELQIQRRMRGVLDQPLVLGPPTGLEGELVLERVAVVAGAQEAEAVEQARSPRCCPTASSRSGGHPVGARRLDHAGGEPGADAAALPLVGDRDREVGDPVAGPRGGVAGLADQLPDVVDGDERGVADVVDLGQVRQLAAAEPGLGAEEPPPPRLVAQPPEP